MTDEHLGNDVLRQVDDFNFEQDLAKWRQKAQRDQYCSSRLIFWAKLVWMFLPVLLITRFAIDAWLKPTHLGWPPEAVGPLAGVVDLSFNVMFFGSMAIGIILLVLVHFARQNATTSQIQASLVALERQLAALAAKLPG